METAVASRMGLEAIMAVRTEGGMVRFTLTLAACFSVASFSGAFGDEPAATAEQLFREGDRLAAAKQYEDALDHWRRAFLQAIPTYRDLSFLSPVGARFLGRTNLRTVLLGEIAKEKPDEEFSAEEIAYARLGFFERGLDLKDMVTNVLTEEIAGFYNPEEKSLFLIAEPKAPRKKSFLEMLVGSSDFDPAEQRMILCHEMAHALADQHFDLFSLMKSAEEEDDDTALAVTALVEGEAMVVMMVNEVGADRRDAILRSSSAMGMVMDFVMRLAVPFATGASFRNAPAIYREQLLFPYTKGFLFAGQLTRTGGWRAVNRAFASPPLSTEQILHPDKFLPGRRDDPVTIEFEGDPPLGDGEWKLVKENVVGELAMGVLLRPTLGAVGSSQAAEGWDGDRYRVYRTVAAGEERTILIWASTWDSELDAEEFATALVAFYRPAECDPLPAGAPAAETGWLTGTGASAVWRDGSNVLFVDTLPVEQLGAFRVWSGSVTRRSKELRLKTFVPGGRDCTE